MFRIHERLAEGGLACQQIIEELDELYGSSHAFSTLMGLEQITTRTAVPKNLPVQRALLLWTLELVSAEMKDGRSDPKLSKDLLSLSISRALLKRRVVQYFSRKFPRGDAWAKMSTMDAFKLNFDGSLQWLGAHPPWLQEAMSFCAKMVRGHVVIDALFDSALKKDSLLQAEEVFRSDEWAKSEILDMAELLSAKQAEVALKQEKAEQVTAETAAAEQAAAVVPETQPESQPAETIADEPMPEATAEEAHVEPQKLDRLQFFSELFIADNSPLKDILHKVHDDDDAFQQIIDFARVRAILNLGI